MRITNYVLAWGVAIVCAQWTSPAAAFQSPGFGAREVIAAYPGGGGDVGQFGSIVHDSTGALHVAYYDATTKDLKYGLGIRAPSGQIGWQLQTVDFVGDVGQFADIGVTMANAPVISYYDATNGALKVAWDQNGDGDFEQDGAIPGRNDATGFQEIRIVDNTSGQTGLWSSIAVADNGQFHVSYKDRSSGVLRYALWDGAMWALETVDNSSPSVGRYSSIVVDDRFLLKVPFIFYQDETNGDLRGAMKIIGAGWVTLSSLGAIDAAGTTGRFIDAAFDRVTGRILISYQNALTGQTGRAELKLSATDPTLANDPTVEIVRSVSDTSVIPQFGDFGHFGSIAIGEDGLPRIAHYDAASGDLVFERRALDGYPSPVLLASTWEKKEKPAASGDVGQFTSSDMAVINDPVSMMDLEFLRVGFYDASRTAFRLATAIDNNLATESTQFASADEGFSFIDGAKVGQYSSLRLDGAERPVAAYFDDARGALFITRRTGPPGDPWEAPTLIDDDTFFRALPSGLTDFDNNPKTSPDNFQKTGQHISMVLDAGNASHIAYYDATARALRYSVFDFATGSAFFDIDPGPFKGEFASQAVSADGLTYAIAYYRALDPTAEAILNPDPRGNGPQLRVAVGDGAANWSVTVVDDTVDAGQHASIAIDASGNFHVAYLDATNFNLKYALGTGGGWATQTVEASPTLDGLNTSIAIHPGTGQPAISYYDLTLAALRYAEFDGVAWNTQTVDDLGRVGQFSKLVFDQDRNIVYIVYYDETGTALKIAHKSIPADTWSMTRIIDDDGDVGIRPSVDITAGGAMRIGYYDSTNGDLVYLPMTAPLTLLGVKGSWVIYK